MTPASACPLCLSREAGHVSSRDRRGAPLTTVLCLNCGLYRTDPLPAPGEIQRFYEHEYRLAYKGVVRPRAHHVLRAAQAARDRLVWLRAHLAGRRRWLDAGAGSGEFACLLGRMGALVSVLEPNRGYAEYMRKELGLAVREGFLEDLAPGEARFEGIAFFHVIEHHPDPVGALARLRSLLAPDGVLAVETPNAAAALHPDKRFHRAHLVHFTLGTLALAAQRAGFAPLECRESSDGGILWGVFTPAPPAPAAPCQESAARLWERERRRSVRAYYASPAVWQRTAGGLARLAGDRVRGLWVKSPRGYLARLPLPEGP